jgi:colicin import membrane protein
MRLVLSGDAPHIDDGFGEVRPLREDEAQVLALSMQALAEPDPDVEALLPAALGPALATWRRALALSVVGAEGDTAEIEAIAGQLAKASNDPAAVRAYFDGLMGAGHAWRRVLEGQVTDLAKARRWITAHPNGPGTRGIPLLIEGTAGGGAKIIGGAGGKLNGQELGKLKPGAGGAAPNTREGKAEAESKAKAEAEAKEKAAADSKAKAEAADKAKKDAAKRPPAARAAAPSKEAQASAPTASAEEEPITPGKEGPERPLTQKDKQQFWKMARDSAKMYPNPGRYLERLRSFDKDSEEDVIMFRSMLWGLYEMSKQAKGADRVRVNGILRTMYHHGIPPLPTNANPDDYRDKAPQQRLFKSRLIVPIRARLAKSTLAPVATPGREVTVGGRLAYWRESEGRGVLQIPLDTGKSLLVLARDLALALVDGAEELARVLSGQPPARALIAKLGLLKTARKNA